MDQLEDIVEDLCDRLVERDIRALNGQALARRVGALLEQYSSARDLCIIHPETVRCGPREYALILAGRWFFVGILADDGTSYLVDFDKARRDVQGWASTRIVELLQAPTERWRTPTLRNTLTRFDTHLSEAWDVAHKRFATEDTQKATALEPGRERSWWTGLLTWLGRKETT